MSYAGEYIRTAKSLFASLEEGKPHTSITDWVEVLSSDRYDELSLDGIPELVESVNIQGMSGTTVSSCLPLLNSLGLTCDHRKRHGRSGRSSSMETSIDNFELWSFYVLLPRTPGKGFS